MNVNSEIKKVYYPPELEFVMYNVKDALGPSQPDNYEIDWDEPWENNNNSGDANTDHNSVGNGDDLSSDDSDSDVNNDYYDIGDGDDLIN